MSESFYLLVLWMLGASVASYLGTLVMPDRVDAARGQFRRLAALTLTGIPVLGFATAQHGPWVGLAVLLGGFLILTSLLAQTEERLEAFPG